MHRYVMRVFAAAAASAALTAVGMTGASASGAVPRVLRAVWLSPAGTVLGTYIL
jgi:hypothetical protein